MKVLSVLYWIITALFIAFSLFSNAWTSALSYDGTSVVDYAFEVVFIIVLISAAMESWRTRPNRTTLQMQIVFGPVYLVGIGLLISLAFQL